MENDAIIKKDGKIIGFVRDGIYTTNRIKDKHFFRMLNGYGVSISVIEKLKELGVKKIIFQEPLCKYEISISDFILKSKAWTDKGRDEQLIIDINECIKVGQ